MNSGSITTGAIGCSSVNASSGTTISSTSIWNYKSPGGNTYILLDPTLSASNRLQIYSEVGYTKYLYFNTSNVLGFYKTAGVVNNIWSIDGDGNILTIGNISCGTVSAPTSLSTILINASTGSNTIQMNNKFFDISNGSIDIKSYYVGFPYITQSLSLTSKYMGIKPLSTGDFSLEINNIAKKIMLSDWASTSIRTEYTWKWFNTSGIGYSIVIIDPDGSIPFEIFTDNLHSGPALRFNSSGVLGLYAAGLAVYKWTIDQNGSANFGTITGSGAITGSSISAGSGAISTSGSISGGTISATTSLTTNLINASSGTNINKIQMDNRFFNTSIGSIDLKGYIVGFPYYTATLTTASKYMGIIPEADGNFSMAINNIAGKIIYSDWTNKFIKTDFVWIWYDVLNAAVISLNNLTGEIISTSISTGSILCSSLNAGSGNITTTGSITTSGSNNIQATSGAVNSKTFQAVNTTTYRSKIQMENLFISTSIESIDLRAQYIGLAHPTLTLSTASIYSYLLPFTGGDVGLYVNNISGVVWQSNHGAKRLESDFTYTARKSGFTSAYKYSVFTNSGTDIGSISMLSASTVAFNQSSDYRLKQDIEPIKNPLERLMKLQPKNYRYIADVADECCCNCYFDGFLAHEIQEIIPMCVSGLKDDPNQMQSIDYSKLTPICVGAIQELNQELNEKIDKMQVLIDSQYDMIKILITRLEKLESK